jgi:hypothetical protein
VGSGIEHAEGGGGGDVLEGFQIWVNVPSARKMDQPVGLHEHCAYTRVPPDFLFLIHLRLNSYQRYGTENPAAIPLLHLDSGASARVLAGSCGSAIGPFKTVTPVQMVDYRLPAAASLQHHVPAELDNALVFCYSGNGSIGGCAVKENSITLLDASSPAARDISLQSETYASDVDAVLSKVILLQGRLLHCFCGQAAAAADCLERSVRHDHASECARAELIMLSATSLLFLKDEIHSTIMEYQRGMEILHLCPCCSAVILRLQAHF